MDEQPKPPPIEGSQEKRNQLENFSKEELIVKCKNLLVIAKKAKASKDDALEENKNLKTKLAKSQEDNVANEKSIEAMKEMVESLTQKKLEDANKIDALSKQIEKKMTRLSEMEIENEASKRQIQRLSDENDSLLAQLQKQEEASQAEPLNIRISTLEAQLEEKLKENKSLQDIIEKNSLKIKNLIHESSDLKATLESQNVEIPKDQLEIKYHKCIEKLKIYREKIFSISEKLNLLKTDKEMLLKTAKDYSQHISNWQIDIANASIKMTERINEFKKQLRQKEDENDELKQQLSKFQDNSKDVEAINELKSEIENLKETLSRKEKELDDEKDASKKIKQPKKTSVLDLEIEAYEKTLDELNKKLEAKKLQDKEFENTIQIQVETIESLKSQIKSLEAHLFSEKSHSIEVKKHLDNQQNLLRKTEHERTEINLQFELLTKNFESLKLENTEIKLQMSQDFGVLQRKIETLEKERDEGLRIITSLESNIETSKKLTSSQEREIEDLKSEFASYKLRAQSVLRQSQTKDFGKELELQDEIKTLQKTIENLQSTQSKQSQEYENFKKLHDELSEDKVRLQKRCKELLETITRHSDEALEESRNRNQLHEDSIKAYQQQIETLNEFYKKKIQDSDSIIKELQEKNSKLEKSVQQLTIQASNSYDIFQMRSEESRVSATEHEDLLAQRTEAEGSEDFSTHSSTFQNRRKLSKNTRELMPLDELLNSSFDNNSNEVNDDAFSTYSSNFDVLEQTKAKLEKEEKNVIHLTNLLAESEKDLARMEQLNEMLKEEIRRQQRNTDREEHIKNSEYLKNVVIKFVTLNNGDEKQRLIPVLNTILRLSSDENSQLQNACKSGWGLWTK